MYPVVSIANGYLPKHFAGNLLFMDQVGKKRVFSARKNVSNSVQTGSISLTAASTTQVQSENAAIAHGLKRQNPELLDQLIELYQHRLLRYLLFLTGKREVAEDLFQETWMRVLLRGAQYNGKARFGHLALHDCSQPRHRPVEKAHHGGVWTR